IGLVDADMRKRLADDVAFGSTSVGRDMIRGFEQGLAQTRPLQRASIEAEAQVYAAIQDLAVFLSSQIGRYTVASDGLFR
ncbi:hypothetical protein, partial [Escherichia coli]|uniref:hypothetical protein n=1 Tax=Escherichia coli TaxID=562 RepID=UPI0013D73A2A